MSQGPHVPNAPFDPTRPDPNSGDAPRKVIPAEPARAPQSHTRPEATHDGAEQVWVSPGVSPRKRTLTALAILFSAALFMVIAAHEGASMWVSTLIGAIFIGCFVWYLRIVAPTPFTLRLDAHSITRQDRGGAPASVPWQEVARVKEEVFKNGTPISLAVYKRVGERGVYRAFVVYRDDVPRFDALLGAVRAALPEGARWQRETVHE